MDTNSVKRLREIASEVGAFLQGDFTLASGQRSDRYFEGKRVTLWPEGARLVGEVLFELLADAGVDAVGGLATGAYPIVTAVTLVSELKGKPLPSFIVREEPKQHGTQRLIEGHIEEGWRVAIVDDVITKGGSIKKAIEAVKAANCQVVKVIVLVDRHEGGSDELRRMGYDFTALLGHLASGEITIEQS